jgi:hypothetical protein
MVRWGNRSFLLPRIPAQKIDRRRAEQLLHLGFALTPITCLLYITAAAPLREKTLHAGTGGIALSELLGPLILTQFLQHFMVGTWLEREHPTAILGMGTLRPGWTDQTIVTIEKHLELASNPLLVGQPIGGLGRNGYRWRIQEG